VPGCFIAIGSGRMRVPRLAVLCAALACLVRLDAHPYHVECDDPLQLGESFMVGGETERAPETAIVRFDGFGCSAAHPVGGEYTPGEVLTVQVTGVPGCALLELTGGATFRSIKSTCVSSIRRQQYRFSPSESSASLQHRGRETFNVGTSEWAMHHQTALSRFPRTHPSV